MSKLRKIRQQKNLTQEELAEKSGISIRTIQRIEAGTTPKGQTLKILMTSLEVSEEELLESAKAEQQNDITLIKWINFSSLLFTLIPPANILVPLAIMFWKKEWNRLAKQILTIQILWTIGAFVLFMLTSMSTNWFNLNRNLTLFVMIILVLLNMLIIITNAVELDKKKSLRIRLGFNMI